MNLAPRFVFTITFVFFSLVLTGQCGVSVFAGNDTTVCGIALPFPVEGVVTGDIENLIGVGWAPEGVFTNPGQAEATFRGNQDTTVYFSAFTALPEDNLLQNAGFSQVLAPWETNYSFEPDGGGGEHGPITSAGSWTISTSPRVAHAQFCDSRDSDGNNRMFVANNSSRDPDVILCQTVNVDPDTEYIFSAAMMNVRDLNPPVVRFAVNNTGIGSNFELPEETCVWNQYSSRWFSGGSTTAQVCIVNRSEETVGNDIAIDELYFGPVCETIDSFRVTIPTFSFNVPDEVFLPCMVPDEGVQLDATGTTGGPNISYQWVTNDGNILAGANTLTPSVNQDGVYTLEVTFDAGTGACTRSRSVQVTNNPFQPVIELQSDVTLSCNVTTAEIEANALGPGFTPIWTTEDGNITENGGDEITVDEPGSYTLTVVAPNGCNNSETIVVPGNFRAPEVNIAEVDRLGCGTLSVTIDASNSDFGPDDELEWFVTNGGQITAGANTLTPTANRAGVYRLRITDQTSGCFNEETVNVRSISFNPNFNFDIPDPFTCDRDQIDLEANITNVAFGTMLGYQWTTTDGTIINGADQPELRIGRPGTYTLTVTNLGNGCEESEDILVEPGIGVPFAEANDVPVLDCNLPSVMLDATGSTTGPNIMATWTDPAGNEITDLNVTQGGTYRLTVVNTDDNCSSFDEVTVVVDRVEPTAVLAAGSQTLTCNALELNLAVDGPSMDFEYSWAGPVGGITTPTDQPTITASLPGNYSLTTTNPANGCSATINRTIFADQETPDISLGAADQITCDNPTIVLQGTINNPMGFEVEWTTPDGFFVSGTDTPTPTVGAGGTYQMRYFNPTTGCSDSASVEVAENVQVIDAVLTGGNSLDCNTPELTLGTTGSTTGTDIVFVWSREGAEVATFPGTEAGDLPVTTAGTYELIVRNETSGCSEVQSIVVTEDFAIQDADFAPGDYLITCTTDQVLLEGAATAEPGLDYTWTRDGMPFPAATGPSFMATEGGEYELTISNPANGCSESASQLVTIDNLIPVAAPTNPFGQLDCRNTSVELVENSMNTVRDIDYNWTGPGTITPSADGRMATVDTPGEYTLTATDNVNGCTSSEVITVSQDIAPPTAAAGTGFTLDCAVASQSLDGSGSSNGPNFSYNWSGPALIGASDEVSPEVGGGGVYTLIVTNEDNGCTAEDMVEVLADFNAPMVSYPQMLALDCRVTEQTINTSSTLEPDWTFEWGTADGNLPAVTDAPELQVSAAGTYTLSVLDPGSGCTTAATVVVTEDVETPPVQIAPPAVLDCRVNSVELDGSLSVLDRPATFSWTSPDGTINGGTATNTASVSSAGTYQLVVTYDDNGCSDSLAVNVVEDRTDPAVAFEEVGALGCLNRTLEIVTDPATREATFTYAWSLAGGTIDGPVDQPSITVNEGGDYSLFIINERNGCEQRLTTNVLQDTTALTIFLPQPATLTCDDPAASALAAVMNPVDDTEFVWTTPDGNIASGRNLQEVTVDAAGTYSVEVTNLITGCVSNSSWQVAADQEQPVISLPAGQDLGCEALPLTISADVGGGPYDFSWEAFGGAILDGGTSASALLEGPGTYVLTAEDPTNGCTASASVVLTQNIIEDFAVEVNSPNCVQTIGSIAFGEVNGGVAPNLFSIDGGETFGMVTEFQNLAPGSYELRVQDARGCETIDSVTIEEPRDLTLDIDPFFTILLGDSLLLNVVTNYSASEIDTIIWSPAEGLSCTDCLTPFARPFRSVAYTVEVRSTDGCSNTTGVTVEVDPRQIAYFPTAFSPNNDGRNDLFLPFGDVTKIVAIRNFTIHDRWGTAVFEAPEVIPNDIRFGWDGTMGGGNVDRPMNTGVYVYSAIVEFLGGQEVLFEGEVMLMR